MKNVNEIKNRIKCDVVNLERMYNSFKSISKKNEIESKIMINKRLIKLIEELEDMQMCIMNSDGNTQKYLEIFYEERLEYVNTLIVEARFGRLIDDYEPTPFDLIVNDGH